jgi:hypothetical protein
MKLHFFRIAAQRDNVHPASAAKAIGGRGYGLATAPSAVIFLALNVVLRCANTPQPG